jgi:hypothetical protein
MMTKKTSQGKHHDGAREELMDVVGCLSCGLPTKRTQREVASEVADICPRCQTSDGHLKGYDEVFERLVTQHFMKHERMSRPEGQIALGRHRKVRK